MIKQIAWNTFKNTGNIDTFLELVQIEGIDCRGEHCSSADIQSMSLQTGEINGTSENERDNIIRK